MIKSNAGQPRGVLNLKAGEKKFQLSRHLPAEDLRFFRTKLLDCELGFARKRTLLARDSPASFRSSGP